MPIAKRKPQSLQRKKRKQPKRNDSRDHFRIEKLWVWSVMRTALSFGYSMGAFLHRRFFLKTSLINYIPIHGKTREYSIAQEEEFSNLQYLCTQLPCDKKEVQEIINSLHLLDSSKRPMKPPTFIKIAKSSGYNVRSGKRINNQRTTLFKINEDWRMKIAKIAALYYIGNYSFGKHIINWAHIVPLSVIIKRSAFILMTLSINVICSYYISARLTLFENACNLLVKEYLKS